MREGFQDKKKPYQYQIRLGSKEIHAIAMYFSKYVEGYMKEDPNTDMIDGWIQLKEAVGESRALQIYWIWTKSLPKESRPDCDPDGN